MALTPETHSQFSQEYTPMIGVLIVTWNRREDVLDCIVSVRQSSYPRLAVYVVDNASTDGTGDAIAERYPETHVIRSEENLGFAGGNNLGLVGMLEDGMDAVFLLNDDAVAAADTLNNLVSGGFHDPTVGVLCPKVLVYASPDVIWSAGGMINPRTGVAVQRRHGGVDSERTEEASDVDYAVGCAMLVKTEVIRAVGMMDSRYYMYYEEADWCRRICHAGYRILYVPQSRVWHKVTLTGNGHDSAAYYFARNRLLYLSTGGAHPGRVAWTALTDIMRSAAAHAVKGRRRESRLMVRAVADYYAKRFGRFEDGS